MAKTKLKNNTYVGKYPAPTAGQYAMVQKNGMLMPAKSIKNQAASTKRVTVDDATWDKAMMEVIEEYDEAWTQLADR